MLSFFPSSSSSSLPAVAVEQKEAEPHYGFYDQPYRAYGYVAGGHAHVQAVAELESKPEA